MSIEAQQRLFEACLEANDDAARERVLAECGDATLRGQVRELLRAHEALGAASASLVAAPSEFPSMSAPHCIGPYRILERIGEGAMGDVYLAAQEAPVRRRVALKILKFGLATREVLARFELERQTLALLTHPNIARIFDAGTTEDGRPYFAMEYVAGAPITRYCDERGLGLAARLALITEVCAGIRHAHLRGVIHRDLKPSNILVAEIDGIAIPKIIDFGIAKATTSASADAHTRLGLVLGTPEYMSPEQAQLSPLDIDARTDVYSLGVVLYQLLTGARPYAVTSDALNPAVLLNEIANREARRPSELAAERSAQSTARAACRGLTPSALAAELRGELDWIVLKAIEKDRRRRYDSAAALAADLQRHANDHPVEAGPPSGWYRLRKFVRRHRLAVGALSAAFAAAIVFGSAMAWFARAAADERDRANLEAEAARRVTAFTAGLFESANPASSGSSDVSARELLDAGVRRLEQQRDAQGPEIRAALLDAAGAAYRGLGVYDRAEALLAEALELRRRQEPHSPAGQAQTLLGLALVKREQGDFDRAVELARQAADMLAASATAEDRNALQRARLELAEILRRRSELEEAAALAESGRRQAADAGQRIRAAMLLGRIRAAQGDLNSAEILLREAYESQLELEGALAEGTFEAKNGLADVLVNKGEPARAEPLLRSLVEEVRQVYGEEHAELGVVLNNLANALSDLPDKLAEAADAYREAAAILRKTKGAAHPEVGTTLNNLGALYLRAQEWEKANDAFEQAVAIRTASIGAMHPDTASAQHGRALALNKLKRYAEAEALLRGSVAAFTRALGAEHWRTANVRLYLGLVLANRGRLGTSHAEMNTAYAQLVHALGEQHPRAVAARKLLGETHPAPSGAD